MLRYAMLRRRLVVWEVSGGYVLEEDEEGRRGAREEGGVGAGNGGRLESQTHQRAFAQRHSFQRR